jgi:hypothetical protein
MQEPKIITTRAMRDGTSGGQPTTAGTRDRAWGGPVGAGERTRTPSRADDPIGGSATGGSRSARRRSFFAHPAFYGLLLVGAGIFVWSILSDDRPSVPKAWQGSAPEGSAGGTLQASVRSAGPGQGDLLRLEWPAHPKAESYVVRFEGVNGFATSPIPILGNVFLYDLKSDVFNLPDAFRWSVTAVMADGMQVTTGSASFQLPPH